MDVTREWIEDIARQAAEIFVKGFQDVHKGGSITTKLSPADLLTTTDLAVEKFLKDTIAAKYPTHRFYCEESVDTTSLITDDPTWIIDPIDGTTNFVHSNPQCTISIGFAINQVPRIGVVYIPMMNDMLSAEVGKGATLNGKPLKTTGRTSARSALVDTGFSIGSLQKLSDPDLTEGERKELLELKSCVEANFNNLLFKTRDMRRTGACSFGMTSVARGTHDALAELSVKEWDIAASKVIVEEAGGYCCQYGGEPLGNLHGRSIVAASTKELALELAGFLKKPTTFNLSKID